MTARHLTERRSVRRLTPFESCMLKLDECNAMLDDCDRMFDEMNDDLDDIKRSVDRMPGLLLVVVVLTIAAAVPLVALITAVT